MPRADMTPVSRAKRAAQQRKGVNIRGRSASFPRTLASTNSLAACTSVSAVKKDPASAAIPPAVSLKIKLPRPGWRHPAELVFIDNWDDMSIIRFFIANAFTIPPRTANAREPLRVSCADGSTVALPFRYRTPLLWVSKFLWRSLEIVLTAPGFPAEWNEDKYAILHVARQCAGLIDSARASAGSHGKDGIDQAWRCAMFDRALLRYWYEWLNVRDDFVKAFWEEFDEEDFDSDGLKLQWGQWVLKDHKGFKLTKQELTNGITAAELMEGFFVYEDRGTFECIPVLPDPPESPAQGKTQLPQPDTDDVDGAGFHTPDNFDDGLGPRPPEFRRHRSRGSMSQSASPLSESPPLITGVIQQLLSLGPSNPSTFAPITQLLADEMRALRDDVSALRGELVGKHPQLERRIRVLEERAVRRELFSGAMEHPLRHLL
ncbi:hypothetical protein B0H13DRAFT_2303395 [Mycena leptocephala]|nr:hypothetical protein B0H13DRAFT_2303395 [Mycena leptocephala]